MGFKRPPLSQWLAKKIRYEFTIYDFAEVNKKSLYLFDSDLGDMKSGRDVELI